MAKVFSIGGSTISYGGFMLRELGSGSLTISKTVSGSGFDPTKTFEITVTFSQEVTYNGTTSTTHTFNLANGQSVTITGIPELTTYEVTETPLSQADLDAGYSISGMTGGSGTVALDGVHTASATNGYSSPATLTITKNVSGNTPSPSESFEIVVTFGRAIKYSVNGTVISTASNTCTLNLVNGQSATIGNIPGGVTYNITENLTQAEQAAGYSLTGITGGSGTAAWAGTHTASVNNLLLAPTGGKTIRFLFADPNEDPTTFTGWASTVSWSQVSSSPNIWDCTNTSSDWQMGRFMNGTVSLPYGWQDVFGDFQIIQMDATGVTSLRLMFFGAYITSIQNVTGTSGVIDTANMFENCEKLTSVQLFDTSSVTDMSSMFAMCEALPTVPLFDTSSVTKMQNMFGGCYALTSVPLFNTQNVTDMGFMFSSCTSLETAPLFDTSSVTKMNQMFLGCTALKSIPMYDTDIVTTVFNMLNGCVNVEQNILNFYDQLAYQSNPPTSHSGCFKNCGINTPQGAAELAQIPSGWK